jgi:hypothetical protein
MNYEHMNYLCKNYDPDAADAAYESYDEGEDVEVAKASRLLALTTFVQNSISAMRKTEISTKKQILCGYISVDQVRQHAKRMGSICLAGTPYKERVMRLSLDRPLVSMSFSHNNKNVSLNTDCDRLSARYSYVSHGMRRLVSFMFCAFYASYRVRMVVQSFWTTRAILPSP